MCATLLLFPDIWFEMSRQRMMHSCLAIEMLCSAVKGNGVKYPQTSSVVHVGKIYHFGHFPKICTKLKKWTACVLSVPSESANGTRHCQRYDLLT